MKIKLHNDASFDLYFINKKAPCIVIIPGGGFLQVTKNEGESVAKRCNQLGYHAVVLQYSIPCLYPKPIEELDLTLEYLNSNKDKYEIDMEKIVLLGFSAGGNIVSNYYHWSNKYKIGAQVLCYPLIDCCQLQKSVDEKFTNAVFSSALGGQYTDTDLIKISPIYRKEKVPPTFIWHTLEDELISYKDSLNYANHIIDQGIMCDIHVFSKGGHGLSLANSSVVKANKCLPLVQQWIEVLPYFLQTVFNTRVGESI